MSFNTNYNGILNDISELLIWSEHINIDECENMDVVEFYKYRSIFEEVYKKKQEEKQNLYDFAKKAVEAIVKSNGAKIL